MRFVPILEGDRIGMTLVADFAESSPFAGQTVPSGARGEEEAWK